METMSNFAFMIYEQFFAPCDVNPTGLRCVSQARSWSRSLLNHTSSRRCNHARV